MINALLADLDGFLGSVARGRSVNVNDHDTKARAIDIATRYFNSVRPLIVEALGEEPELATTDTRLQLLLRLAQGNNSRNSYANNLRTIRQRLRDLNVRVLAAARPSSAIPSAVASAEEQLLTTTLDGLVPSAAASYRQGLLDLRSTERLSYRGTAAEFREALRETLDHLAPDSAVTAQDGFKLEAGQTKPTMKQKVRFVLKSRGLGKTQRESVEKSLSLIDERLGEVTRAVYDRASVATHIAETKDEVRQIKRFVDTVLFDLLEIRAP